MDAQQLVSGRPVRVDVEGGAVLTLAWYPDREERKRELAAQRAHYRHRYGPALSERTEVGRLSWTFDLAGGQALLLTSIGPFVVSLAGPAQEVSPDAALYWWVNHGLGAVLGIRSLDQGAAIGDPSQ